MVTDPSGRHVAWPVVARRTATVVLRSYVGGSASHRERDFPARPRCCADPFVVNGITAAGELVASSPAANKAWIWNIQGRQLRQIDGVGHGTVGEIAVNGIVVEHPRSHYAFGDVRDGAFRRTASFRTHTAYFGDPLGRRLVYVDEAGEIYVRQRVARRGRRFGPNLVRLELPAITAGFAAARWEDTEHVLLDVFDIYLPEGALVRCQVLTGACEIAARLVGPHVVAR